MKKGIIIVLAAIMVLVLAFGVSSSASTPSAKATAKVSELTLLEWSPDEPSGAGPGEIENSIPADPYDSDWTTILTQNIKTANQKDLFVDVSLETGLYTRTLVRSKVTESDPLGVWDSSKACSNVIVRVGVDGEYATVGIGAGQEAGVAFPRQVTFNEREQTLSAKFMGIFTGDDLIVDPVTHAVTINYDGLDYEELELILNTLSANSFNFIVADLGPGNHVITVEAKIQANGAAQEGSYEAMAMVGQGSVTIEEVRMIQGEDYLDLSE